MYLTFYFTVVVLFCFAVGDRLSTRWQQKGYGRLHLYLLLLLAVILGWAAAMALWYVPEHSASVQFAAFVLSPLVGFTVVSTVVLVAPARVITADRARTTLHTFGRLGELVLVFGPVIVLFSRVPDTRVNRDDSIRWAIFLLAYLVLEFARRVASVHHGSHADSRRPVLFLREFRSEPHFLSVALWKPYQFFWRIANPDVYPFEDFVVSSLRHRIGPVIALGNPLDALPPGDAERVYVSDTGWKAEFGRLAEQSQAVLIQPGVTTNLEYEARHLLERGCADRLFVIVPPANVPLPGPGELILTGFAFAFMRRSYRRIFESPPEWTACRMSMESVGFDLHDLDPGFGSVIAFDVNGVGVLLAEGLTTSDQVARVIQKRLERTAATNADPPGESASWISPRIWWEWCRKSPVAIFLVAALALTFMAGATRLGGNAGLVTALGSSGVAITSGEWWRLVTSLIVHTTFFQLVINAAFLLIVGRFVEQTAGPFFLLVVFVVAGVIGGLTSVAVYPFFTLVGAASSILGLYGALAATVVRHPRNIGSWISFRHAVTLLAYACLVGPTGPVALSGVGGFGAGAIAGMAMQPLRGERAQKVRSTWTVLTGVAALIVVMVFARFLPRFEDASAKIQKVAALDATMVKQFNDGLEKVRTGTWSERQLEQSLQDEMLPAVRSQREILTNLGKLRDDQQREVDVLRRYVALREEGWEFLARALNEQNPRLVEEWRNRELQIQTLVSSSQAARETVK